MQIQDKKSIKAKSFTMKAIMRNPKLVATISEAMDSPIGSTKRKKAKMILKSLKLANVNYFGSAMQDGQGGAPTNFFAGMMPQPAVQPKMKTATPTMPAMPMNANAGVNIDPQTGMPMPMRRLFVQSIDHLLARKKSGQGGCKEDGKGGANNPLYNNPYDQNNGMSIDPSKIQDTSYQANAGLPTPYSEKSSGLYVNPAIGNAASTIAGGVKNIFSADYNPDNVTSVERVVPESDTQNVYNIDKGKFETVQKTTPTTGGAVNPPAGATVKDNGFVGPLQSGSLPTESELDNAYQAGGITAIDDWYKTLDKSGQSMYADLYKAYSDGMGSAAWAQKALSDKNILSKVLGLSKDVLDMFPNTGLINEQLIKLKNQKKAEYNLVSWENKMKTMLNQGGYIKNDLQAYIRGKDQYLGQIDKMLDEAKTSFANMDTSNPYVQQRTGMYVNYLTILKGRQNQRYADFLDSSINYYNAELQATERAYEGAYNKFKEEYTEEAALTSEVFENTKSLLQDMYTNLEKKENKIAEANQLEVERQKNAFNTMLSIIESDIAESTKKSLLSATTGLKEEDFDGMDLSNPGKTETKYNAANLDSSMGITSDKDGTYMTTYDGSDALSMAESAGQSRTNAYNRFIQAAQAYLSTQIGTGGDTSLIGNFGTNFDGYGPLVELANSKGVNSLDAVQKDEYNATTILKNRIVEGASAGIKKYLSGMQDVIYEMIDDISGGDSEDDVVENYRNNGVNEQMIKNIYTVISNSPKNRQKNISTLSNDISEYLVGSLY